MALPTSLSSRKALVLALLACSAALIVLTLLAAPSFRQYTAYPAAFRFRRPLAAAAPHRCPPEAYAAGNWTRRPAAPALAAKDGVLALAGFEGCASSREVAWHLGTSWDEQDDAKKRVWRGNASAYAWAPGPACAGYTPPAPAELLRQLVEDGGWLVLGDSITEGHFFSLSCTLYPHVRATPDYTLDPWSFDRAWPQHLYLDPASPLLPQLRLPDGFELDTTPLVTFRRVDLPLSKTELDAFHAELHPDAARASIFSDEGTWTLDSAAYLAEFVAPLPAAHYRTLVLSTAGHWTTSLFGAFHRAGDAAGGDGLRELLVFFEKAMRVWADRAAAALEQAAAADAARGGRGAGKERRIVVRAYQHGHEACHDEEVELAGPVREYRGLRGTWYNWNWIRMFNDVFQDVITQRGHRNIHFLNIDMPGLLRPDGHVQGDCLHILTGAGIMEGWSEYISYFVSQLP